jgi:hypothetical protein
MPTWAFEALSWDGVATIVAALLAAGMVVWGYTAQQKADRKARQAILYGEAIQAVHDYLELPYRVRRRDGSAAARMAVTSHASDVQSRIDYYKTLLRIHAPDAVCGAYDALVAAAKSEAGPQMTAAWVRRPTRHDRDVSLGSQYSQPRSAAAMEKVIALMEG